MNVRGNVRAGLTTRLIEDESHPDYDPHTSAQFAARRRSLSDRAARSRDRPPARPHARARGRVPAGSEPGRQVARLLHPLRRAPGVEADRPDDRRGPLAQDGRPARRQPGRRRARSRRLPEVRVHAGFEITHHQLRRQDLAGVRAGGRGGRDSVHCEGRPAARAAREVRLSDRRREAQGVADPRRPSVA